MPDERVRDSKINDLTCMIVWCRFIEISFSNIFPKISFEIRLKDDRSKIFFASHMEKIFNSQIFPNLMSFGRGEYKRTDCEVSIIWSL